MIYNLTNVYERNANALLTPTKRIAINQGGTSSSKTFSILQLLVNIAQKRTKDLLISVVSESLPHLKRGCIKDFKTIMGNDFEDKRWHVSDSFYQFNKAKIEFFGADDASKLRGGRRDILYINEVNNISKHSYDELDIRTRRFTFLDYNPVAEFWAMDMINLPEVEYIHSTYFDAKHVLPKSIIEKIELKRDRDPNWWRVYGEGLTGSLDGLIYPNFKIIENYPEQVKYERLGLDFGFTNDPTALIKCGVIGGELYLDELIYQTNLTNQDTCKLFRQLNVSKSSTIIADCADPKSIEEIHREDYFIQPCVKGPDSIIAGINKIKEYTINVTKRSVNLIKELRNYQWKIDKLTGKPSNIPIDSFNHALDAVRYAVWDIQSNNQILARVL
jgi:phage terminase large subunit